MILATKIRSYSVQTWLTEAVLTLARPTTSAAAAQLLATALTRPTIVLARVWLVSPEGLLLFGSAGTPTGGGAYSRLDGTFSRIALGEGKIGQIAASQSPLIVSNLRGDEDWLANQGWIARQGVRAFVGHPIASEGELLGVMALFDRARPGDDDLAAWEFLARYAATRLIELRARDELTARLRTLETSPAAVAEATAATADVPRTIVTRSDLRTLERHTLEAALTQTAGRVFGPRGAALLLGMKPTTLASRMKALGLPPARAIRRARKP